MVLVVERSEEGKAHGVQRPVYFISEVLSPTKQRYLHYQKLAYSVFTTTRKLRQYFAVHPIIVVNEAPLSNILNNPSATGRVSLWGIELSPLSRPRILSNFWGKIFVFILLEMIENSQGFKTF
jgi:hypothetical protein